MDRWMKVLTGALIVCVASVGCEPQGGGYKTAQQIKTEKGTAGDDEHGAAGPHGGAIVELGNEEYHGEVVVDGKTHTLTVYLFGPDAKTPAPIAAAEVTVTTEDDKKLVLKAVDAKDGKASQFQLDDKSQVEALVDAGYLHGSLQFDADGKPYHGGIDAHFDGSEHGDEKHEDEKHDENEKSAPAEKADETKPAGDGEKTDASESKDESAAPKDAGKKSEIPDPPAKPE
jgi:hypothetical protein